LGSPARRRSASPDGSGVFLDAVEEVDTSVVASMRYQPIECFGKHIIEDHCLRKPSGVDAPKNRKPVVVSPVAAVGGCKENRRIDDCTGYLLVVDASGVVVARDIGFLIAVVAVERAEGAAALLDDLHANTPLVFDPPAEFVAVADVEFPPDARGNVCLIARDFALGVDALTTHIRDETGCIYVCIMYIYMIVV